MKGSSIIDRKKELMKRQRHKDKISMTRSTAVRFRWAKTKSGSGSNTEGEDGATDTEEIIELLELES